MAIKRKGISKKLRFEVFKRDKFKCRYCGKSPLSDPITLALDHVIPVAKGGGDDIVNLVTSCSDCNSGKSDRLLSDEVVLKQTIQEMEAIQERTNQLKEMVRWRKSLDDQRSTEVDELCRVWEGFSTGYRVSENGKATVKRWVKHYGVGNVMDAITAAAEQHLTYEQSGKVTEASYDNAWGLIPRIAAVKKRDQETPGTEKMLYIRGIIFNRFTNRSLDARRNILFILEQYQRRGLIYGQAEVEKAKQVESFPDFVAHLEDVTAQKEGQCQSDS